MKKNSIYKLLAMFVVLTTTWVACTEDMSEVRLDADLTTTQSMDVTSNSAIVEGYIVAKGSGFSEKGVCYALTEMPTVDDNMVVYEGDEEGATFSVTLTDLDYATKYYARAYGISGGEVMYGEEKSFTTLPIVPTVTTAAITEVTGNSAASGGEVTDDGRAEISERGIIYSLSDMPTMEEDSVLVAEEAGMGAFVLNLTELLGNATYFVRAYSINSAGIAYGPVLEFKTEIDLPVATTDSVNTVTKTSAMLYGNAPYDGGDAITAKGFVWGLTTNPTIADNVVDMIAEEAEFGYELSALELNTSYFVRAFATNSIGTAYGEEIAFKTLAEITKLYVVGDYNEWTNDANAEFIISTATSEGLAEGFIYLATGGFKLIMDPGSWDAATTFGDNGSGALTNPGENIAVAADGYYRVRANLSTMTYSLLKMDWGVIGDATPGGWDGETALTYDSDLKILNGAFAFTEGEFKFRANGNWDYNFGSDDADGELQVGGANIPVVSAGNYAVTLDLSVPNEYTYSANRWGVIGGASPGGWDNDTFMTWDELNKVYSVTLEMTDGEWKFRANGGWDVNFGGDIGALTAGGSNMAVAAGNYTITLDPWSGVGTITLND